MGLPVEICYPAKPECPVVVLTWKGLNPDLPSILLNSHMDVVPVDESRWTHPPFGAEIDETGKIFARGTQDMKCCGMQYLGAIRALQRDGIKLQRTIVVTFVPDEEIGSEYGMKAFVQSSTFEKLNVGFGLDEAAAYPFGNSMFVFHAERTSCSELPCHCSANILSIWVGFFSFLYSISVLRMICQGQAGHGSMMIENTAGQKVNYMLNKMMQFRDGEAQKLKDDPQLTPGEITTLNLTMIEGGLANNIVPNEMSLIFDIRLAIDVDHDKFHEQVWNQIETILYD